MKRIAVLFSLAAVFAASVAWMQTQPRFTGASVTMDGKDLSVARRHFEPGARTYWHSHDNGQLLLVEKGRMRTQKRGQSVRELGAGESDYTAPNVQHWHGATPNEELVQINVGFSGGTKWLEEVTTAQYNAGK
ncbi:MAG TPA: cupin domain-containing protein [Vicinamibacterales bacterium]|nr:cupin domain-containing protein [Vicinamibacterales bacterium]